MLKDAFEGKIEYLQVMDENGNVDDSLFPKDLDDNRIVEMYRYMLFARALDAKMLSLQRQGRAATYAPLIGQEGEQIGSAFALREKDTFVPNFRQHGVFLVRGFPLENFMVYWKGYEDGGKIPANFGGTAVSVPVGTQVPHAAGIAFARKYKNSDAAVVAYVGDGGTSEGDFYEGINFAGIMKLPLVTIIENNQWAISVPRSKQTAAQTLAQKAIAAGIKGMQVDGNDLLAMYKATSEAIAAASRREGPTLIEAVTYRMSMHTTADDPTKYRSDEEVAEWQNRDPIKRVKAYLVKKGFWNDEMEKQTMDEQLKKIDGAVDEAEKFKPDPKSMFENVYSFMPDALKQEMDDGAAANYWQ